MTKLQKIIGVGNVGADRLIEAGYPDVESLAPLSDPELSALDLKVDSIGSIRELVPNAKPSPSPESKDESTSEKPSEESSEQDDSKPSEVDADADAKPDAGDLEKKPSSEASVDSQNQAGNDKDSSSANTSAEGQSTNDESKAELQADPIELEFTIFSGQHKGRTLKWKEGNPSASFKDGLFVSLNVLSMHKRPDSEQNQEGLVVFTMNYGPTANGGALPANEFRVFSEAIAKKSVSRQFNRRKLG